MKDSMQDSLDKKSIRILKLCYDGSEKDFNIFPKDKSFDYLQILEKNGYIVKIDRQNQKKSTEKIICIDTTILITPKGKKAVEDYKKEYRASMRSWIALGISIAAIAISIIALFINIKKQS